MFRKFILTIVMLIPLTSAAFSGVAIPVLIGMGFLVMFTISVAGTRNENIDEKS